MVQIFREGGAHAPAVITTTDTIRFTTHLHTVPHGPLCSKNGARLPLRLPRQNAKDEEKELIVRVVRARTEHEPTNPIF